MSLVKRDPSLLAHLFVASFACTNNINIRTNTPTKVPTWQSIRADIACNGDMLDFVVPCHWQHILVVELHFADKEDTCPPEDCDGHNAIISTVCSKRCHFKQQQYNTDWLRCPLSLLYLYFWEAESLSQNDPDAYDASNTTKLHCVSRYCRSSLLEQTNANRLKDRVVPGIALVAHANKHEKVYHHLLRAAAALLCWSTTALHCCWHSTPKHMSEGLYLRCTSVSCFLLCYMYF